MNGHRMNPTEDRMLDLIQRHRDKEILSNPKLMRLLKAGLTKDDLIKHLRSKGEK
jgi:acyl-coenzyme A synthetase/AMP-(fatty) acid ligase